MWLIVIGKNSIMSIARERERARAWEEKWFAILYASLDYIVVMVVSMLNWSIIIHKIYKFELLFSYIY